MSEHKNAKPHAGRGKRPGEEGGRWRRLKNKIKKAGNGRDKTGRGKGEKKGEKIWRRKREIENKMCELQKGKTQDVGRKRRKNER